MSLVTDQSRFCPCPATQTKLKSRISGARRWFPESAAFLSTTGQACSYSGPRFNSAQRNSGSLRTTSPAPSA